MTMTYWVFSNTFIFLTSCNLLKKKPVIPQNNNPATFQNNFFTAHNFIIELYASLCCTCMEYRCQQVYKVYSYLSTSFHQKKSFAAFLTSFLTDAHAFGL